MTTGRHYGNFGRAGLMLLVAAALFAAIALPRGAAASSEQPLYSFCAQFNCVDGLNPVAGLVMDAAGNLYGTTVSGGAGGPGPVCTANNCGVVFRLAPDGTETVLYSFCAQPNCADGANPGIGSLIMDAAGNLYGTTERGGAGDGVVFKLAPDGTETVLYSFCPTGFPCADGAQPEAGLIMDAAGNLYGTTFGGGTSPFSAFGFGVVFKLAPEGTYTVLYSFCQQSDCADGSGPLAGLLMDTAGNLYGATEFGGSFGRGVVFALAPDGTETVLYSFCAQANCTDGAFPQAALIMDAAGNLYGTTFGGGTSVDCSPFGCGVVFKLAPGGAETVLYNFCSQSGCADGANPAAGLIADAAGNLYGTAQYGGTSGHNAGVAFAVAPDGTETVLYSFCSVIFCFDGAFPQAGLIMDAAGNLYGTTYSGGGLSGGSADSGVVFELMP